VPVEAVLNVAVDDPEGFTELSGGRRASAALTDEHRPAGDRLTE
jgi:hypothetical protein